MLQCVAVYCSVLQCVLTHPVLNEKCFDSIVKKLGVEVLFPGICTFTDLVPGIYIFIDLFPGICMFIDLFPGICMFIDLFSGICMFINLFPGICMFIDLFPGICMFVDHTSHFSMRCTRNLFNNLLQIFLY